MIRSNAMKVVSLVLLACVFFASACGAQPKKVAPNDEVTVPMDAEDEAAIEGEDEAGTDETPAPDTAPPTS